MQRRRLFSGALAGGSLISLILWLASMVLWLLDQVGRVQTARDIYNNLGPFQMKGITFNWPVIYFWLFVISTCLLAALNWPYVRAWYRARTVQRIWDYPASEAINWIAVVANVRTTLTYSKRFDEAAEMFRDYAAHRRFVVAGKPPGSGLLVPIPRRAWGRGLFQFKLGKECMSSREEVTEVLLVDRSDKSKVLYRGLMVDDDDIRRFFPG